MCHPVIVVASSCCSFHVRVHELIVDTTWYGVSSLETQLCTASLQNNLFWKFLKYNKLLKTHITYFTYREIGMDNLLGKLVWLTLLGLFLSKVISSIQKLNDGKLGTTINMKRWDVLVEYCWQKVIISNPSSKLVWVPSITMCVETDYYSTFNPEWGNDLVIPWFSNMSCENISLTRLCLNKPYY